jgi:Dolichyl-phosphate-mannose-protein mannosyltransferase
VSLVPSALSLATRRQLYALGGLTDNWIYLGAHLRVAGILGEGETPMALRAPGYPFFVAGLFAAGMEKPPQVTDDYMRRGAQLVYAAQALLLTTSGLLLFLWLRQLVHPVTAFAAGLLLATSPYAVVLVGLMHYSILHIFFLVAGGLALHHLLARDRLSWRAVLAVGLLWGCATLVRSTSLILPVFAFGLFWLRWRDLRRALGTTLIFGAGMAMAIAPATIRNYRVLNRVVPVNLQAGAVMWGSTVKPLPDDPDSYRWYAVSNELLQVFTRVTGHDTYDYSVFARHYVELEDAFGKEARANLRRDPSPYLVNALRSVKMLCLDTSSVFIRMFGFSQPPRPFVNAFWFRSDVSRYFLPVAPARNYVRLGAVLTVLAGVGVAAAVLRLDTLALVPVALFASLVTAHALTLMDLMYHYVRLPFVAFLAFYGLEALAGLTPPALRPKAAVAARVAAVLLCAASMLLTAQLLAS